jgi:signal peptidase II
VNPDLPASVPTADSPAGWPSAFLTWWKLPLAIAFFTAASDQISKLLVIETVPLHRNVVVIPHFFHLVHLRNTGAAWGMLSGRTQMLAVLSIIVFAFILWRFKELAEGCKERALALSLILGGIIGNLVDRVCRGEVVDFLLFFYHSFQWPAFNLADTAICVGVILFILTSFLREHNDGCQQDTASKQSS